MTDNSEFENILVTGGNGFIGTNFIKYVLNKYPSQKVTNIDSLTYAGNLENLSDMNKNPNYTFLLGDITNFSDVEKALKGCDAVVHFAAESHVDRSINSVSKFLHTNVYGTFVLLQSSLAYDIKKFVMISTDEVYGDISVKQYSKECDELRPRNPYAASKVAADRLAFSFHETYGLPVVITRSSNNFGPYQYPEKLIPLFITNLLRGKKVPLYGDGLNVRDWLFVEDNCRAIDLVLRSGKKGEVYNVGGGNEYTNIDITKMVLSLLQIDESRIQYVSDRLGHDRRYALDSTKIKHELGWLPSKTFRYSLKETVSWYIENSEWWNTLLSKGPPE